MNYNNLPTMPPGMLKAIEEGNLEEYFKSIPQVAKDYVEQRWVTPLDKIDYERFSDI